MEAQLYLPTIQTHEELAIERLRAFQPEEGYYLAFSGGKDSIVLLDLAKRAGVRFDAHHHLTGIDPPELVRFVREHYPEVPRERAGVTMWQLIVSHQTPPTRLIRFCCQHLKERGGIGRLVLTGVRWAESQRRRRRRMVEACRRGTPQNYLHPILDWTTEQVWAYIRGRGLAYPSLYDEGFSRLGCIGCPLAGDGRRREFARWPGYERAYRRAFAAMLARREASGLSARREAAGLQKHPWRSVEDVWGWWMEEWRGADLDADDAQCELFGGGMA